jgi:hypothetical protein
MFRVVKSVYYTFICVHGMYGIYTLYMYVYTVYMCKQFLITYTDLTTLEMLSILVVGLCQNVSDKCPNKYKSIQ